MHVDQLLFADLCYLIDIVLIHDDRLIYTNLCGLMDICQYAYLYAEIVNFNYSINFNSLIIILQQLPLWQSNSSKRLIPY